MTKALFSWTTLAGCWVGLAGTLGAGAVALQLTTPPPAPVSAPPPVAVVAAPTFQPSPAAAPAPVPFQNSSLVALLPPVMHALPHLAPSLPVPPVPPVRHIARVEPRHVVPVYAAEPPPAAYAREGWGPAMPYPGPYGRGRPYAYSAPPSYYGW